LNPTQKAIVLLLSPSIG